MDLKVVAIWLSFKLYGYEFNNMTTDNLINAIKKMPAELQSHRKHDMSFKGHS